MVCHETPIGERNKVYSWSVVARRRTDGGLERSLQSFAAAEPNGRCHGFLITRQFLDAAPRGFDAHLSKILAGGHPGLLLEQTREITRAHMGISRHVLDARDGLEIIRHPLLQGPDRIAIGHAKRKRRAQLRLIALTLQEDDKIACDGLRDRMAAIRLNEG